MTFFLGGLITTAARLARANIRPLLLPNPNEQPSSAKKLYDLAGTVVTVIMVNYATVPFMLLTVKDSVTAWSHLAWYGNIIIFAAFAFFYGGGTKYLRRLQKEKGLLPGKANGHASGSSTPMPALAAPLDKVICFEK